MAEFPSVRLACLAVVLPLSAWALPESDGASDPVPTAQAAAAERRQPLLVDFQAPWCYSCYYMARHVTTGPDWDRARQRFVMLELDADAPAGRHWMAQWQVHVMPTYLMFDADGNEIGRLLGEQTRSDFYQWLARTESRGAPLEAVSSRVTDGSDASLEAARAVLRTHHARGAAAAALAWVLGLPDGTRAALLRDRVASQWIGRLELQRSHAAGETTACLKAAAGVLAGSLGCARPYELRHVMACADDLDGPGVRALLAPQAARMELLLDKRVWSDASRCADERSIVIGAVDLHERLGDAEGAARILRRAIDDARRRLDADAAYDRSVADNLRVYLERAGRHAALDALLLDLAERYPDEYVYPYRLGRSLSERGRHADALPWFRRAAHHAYGANRLRNALFHVHALEALGDPDAARRVAQAALSASGPGFRDEAAPLRERVTSADADAGAADAGSAAAGVP